MTDDDKTLQQFEEIERRLNIKPLPDMLPHIHTSKLIEMLEDEFDSPISASIMHTISRLEMTIQDEFDKRDISEEE